MNVSARSECSSSVIWIHLLQTTGCWRDPCACSLPRSPASIPSMTGKPWLWKNASTSFWNPILISMKPIRHFSVSTTSTTWPYLLSSVHSWPNGSKFTALLTFRKYAMLQTWSATGVDTYRTPGNTINPTVSVRATTTESRFWNGSVMDFTTSSPFESGSCSHAVPHSLSPVRQRSSNVTAQRKGDLSYDQP